MKTYLLTLDYELWGDGSGDVFQLMIEPTAKILDVCDQFNAKMTIFFEVVEYWRLQEEWAKGNQMGYSQNPAEAIENQLREAVKNGHDVQLHLHPQWVDACWKDGRWVIDEENWRVGDYIPKNGLTLNDLFKKGKETLEKLLQPVKSDYRCIAFRAGGYCVLPSEKVVEAMCKNGFQIDSSVFNGGYTNGKLERYDFRNISEEKGYYFIESDVRTATDIETNLIEIPILAMPVAKWKKFLRPSKIISALKNVKKTNTELALRIDRNKKNSFCNKISFFLGRQYQNWDFCVINNALQNRFIKQTQYLSDQKNRDFFVVTGHPKSLISLMVLRNLLQKESSKASFSLFYSVLNHINNHRATSNAKTVGLCDK